MADADNLLWRNLQDWHFSFVPFQLNNVFCQGNLCQVAKTMHFERNGLRKIQRSGLAKQGV